MNMKDLCIKYEELEGVSCIKEMEYGEPGDRQILCSGFYKDYYFEIVSYGSHPCAYVYVLEDSYFFEKTYSELTDIRCHGGLTYSEYDDDYENIHPDEKNWILGWDYAHAGDCTFKNKNILLSMMPDVDWGASNGRQYTVQEILEEDVIPVINQMVEIENSGDVE